MKKLKALAIIVIGLLPSSINYSYALNSSQVQARACQELQKHNEYWKEHGGVDLDPLKRITLEAQCQAQSAVSPTQFDMSRN